MNRTTNAKLAQELLRQIIRQAEWGTLARCEQLARDALAALYATNAAEQAEQKAQTVFPKAVSGTSEPA